MKLEGSPTERALREAFRREAEMAARLGYFARRADVEGHAEAAAMLRALADGELSHAYGHLEFLEEIDGGEHTAASVGGLRDEKRKSSTVAYGAHAATARADGFSDAVLWFEAVAAAEAVHVDHLNRVIERLSVEGRP